MALRILFIYSFSKLFNGVVNSSGCVASNQELVSMWNEATETYFNVCPSSYLKGLSKTTKISIGCSLRRPRFDVGTSLNEMRGVTACAGVGGFESCDGYACCICIPLVMRSVTGHVARRVCKFLFGSLKKHEPFLEIITVVICLRN
jgi:hypothetical protein